MLTTHQRSISSLALKLSLTKKAPDFSEALSGASWNRTSDTRIFSTASLPTEHTQNAPEVPL